MASIIHSPQKIKLFKAFRTSFSQAGWTVAERSADTHDFQVDCGVLSFFVKCLDETRIKYESAASILVTLERHARELRASGNRQLVVVFDREFLSVDLASLVDRSIFALTMDDISIVTSLAAMSDRVPEALTQRQAYLLERSLDYAILISRLHHEKGDFASAITWGRHAVQHSAGYSFAYLWLFQLLKDSGKFDAAAEIAEKIRVYRPDDRHFLLGMEDLARRRGNLAEAARWRDRLESQPTTARTFEDILAKQQMQHKAKQAPGSAASAEPQGPRASGRSWLRGLVRRSVKD